MHLISDCSTTLDELKALIEIVADELARLLAAGAAHTEGKEAV